MFVVFCVLKKSIVICCILDWVYNLYLLTVNGGRCFSFHILYGLHQCIECISANALSPAKICLSIHVSTNDNNVFVPHAYKSS